MNMRIGLENVSYTITDYEILRDVSVAFPERQVTFIVGKAGSGKSTLLKVAAGLIIPQTGKVFYEGTDLAHMSRSEETAFRRKSAFAFQDGALWANQTIYNNLSLPVAHHEPGISKAAMDRRVREIAQRVGYDEALNLRPAELSMGEQKLISIARALILDPELLFFDEPTASLDDASVGKLIQIVAAMKKEGKTMLIVSHDGRLIAETADQLCVVDNGTVAGFGDANQVAPLLGADLIRRIRAAHLRNAAIEGNAAIDGSAGET